MFLHPIIMKRIFSFLLVLTLSLGVGCSDSYDDTALKEQLAELERRIEAAETVIKGIPSGLNFGIRFIHGILFVQIYYLQRRNPCRMLVFRRCSVHVSFPFLCIQYKSILLLYAERDT